MTLPLPQRIGCYPDFTALDESVAEWLPGCKNFELETY